MVQVGKRGRQRQRKSIIFGTLILLVVIGIAAGAIYYQVTRTRPLDADSLCPADGPAGHYVLLLDTTDPLTFTQDKAFKVMLLDLVNTRIPEGYLFSVFALGEDFKSTADPLIELCNPGSDKDQSQFTANLERRKRQYQERFVGPLIKQSEALMSTQSAKTSPIFEMLQLVGINAFRKHNIKGERRLVIVSDMLQNTDQFTMYKEIGDYPTFARTDYGRRTQPDLQGVQIELHYLMNTPKLQTRRNLDFWEALFNKAGARVVAVRPLEG